MSKTIQITKSSRSFADNLQDQNAWLVFLLLCIGYAAVTFIQDHYILTREVYHNTLGEQLTIERIDEMLDKQAGYKWLSYALIPLIILIQNGLIAICINSGTIAMNYKVKFTAIFKTVMKASVIFLIGKIIVSFIYLFTDIHVFDDLITSDKFSLSGYFSKDSIPAWLRYPLSIVNVFEIVFWLLLSWGVSRLIQKSYSASFGFVAATYGIGLLMWMLFIVFLSLNLS